MKLNGITIFKNKILFINMNFEDSIMFKNIEKTKLRYLIDKYKNITLTIENMQDMKDKDECIYCYYLYKYQQKKAIYELNDLFNKIDFIN